MPDQARILNDRLKQLLDHAAPDKKRSAKVDLDTNAVTKLRSLGYVAGDITEDFQLDPDKDDPKDLIDFHNTYTSVSDLILQKKYDQAESLCQKLAQKRPRVYQIYVLLSSIARERRDLDTAAAHLSRAVEVRPDVAKLHQYLGAILTEQQKFDQAVEHLQKSLQLDPDQFSVHHELAAIFYLRRNYDQALTHLNHALRLQPDSAKTLARIGDVHAQNGNLNLAADFFKKALDSDPLDVQNHLKFANAFVLQKKYDQASRHLQKAIRTFLKHQRNQDAQKLKNLLEKIESQKNPTP
jgi:tetratricopeptide (TPR) repeat protein